MELLGKKPKSRIRANIYIYVCFNNHCSVAFAVFVLS